MDLLTELEALATSAEDQNEYGEGEPSQDTIARWQSLFGYTYEEARDQIASQRDDCAAFVPIALWETVKKEQELLGYDREAYSHWLARMRRSNPTTASKAIDESARYLVRLEGPLESPDKIRQIAGMTTVPSTCHGSSEEDGSAAEFCTVDGHTKKALVEWLARHTPGFRPLFVMQSTARKELSPHSLSPTLGVDSTLPHRRLEVGEDPCPAQDQYPVWYFFYGTLADPAVLARLLGHIDGENSRYELVPARVKGGTMRSWGRYRALVDGPPASETVGMAFVVESREHEDALRAFETKSYEVVRCSIEITERETRCVQGCTFRFVGQAD